MPVRTAFAPLLSAYASNLDVGEHTHVTLLGLGRGINDKGELNSDGRLRVLLTLQVARDLQKRGIKVLIIWTGFKNLRQVKDGIDIGGPGSEAAAMLAFAQTLAQDGDNFEQEIEEQSTSTVGNMAYCAALLRKLMRKYKLEETLIAPVTDTLHYRYGRVVFAARLAFPTYDIRPVVMPFTQYSRKQRVMQALSAFTTRYGMYKVERGNKKAILKRQAQLEKATGWLIGR